MKIMKVSQWMVFIVFCLFLHATFAGPAADSKAIEFNTYHTDVTPGLSNLINQMIEKKKYHDVLIKIDDELEKDPKNVTLLYKKAALDADLEHWKSGIATLDELLRYQPTNEIAIQLKKNLEVFKQKEPHNEIGFDQDMAHVSDLNAYWQYNSLHYYRLTDVGNFGGRINYAHRYGTTGKQFQIELFPQFSDHIYANLILGYANTTQILFPNLQYRIDGYYNTTHGVELSLGQGGQKYLRFSNQKIFLYTGSLGKYQGNFYVWFRPYHYTPKSTEYYEVGVRRYFSDANNYVGAVIGAGKLPDIGDLPPIDQMIVINQKGIGINSQFSLSKSFFIKLAAGYVKQLYPNSINREITDVNIGLIMKL